MIMTLDEHERAEHKFLNNNLCITMLTSIHPFLRELLQPLDQVSEALADAQPFISGLHSIRLGLLLIKLLVQPREHDLEQERAKNRCTKHCGDNAVAGAVAVCFVEPYV